MNRFRRPALACVPMALGLLLATGAVAAQSQPNPPQPEQKAPKGGTTVADRPAADAPKPATDPRKPRHHQADDAKRQDQAREREEEEDI